MASTTFQDTRAIAIGFSDFTILRLNNVLFRPAISKPFAQGIGSKDQTSLITHPQSNALSARVCSCKTYFHHLNLMSLAYRLCRLSKNIAYEAKAKIK